MSVGGPVPRAGRPRVEAAPNYQATRNAPVRYRVNDPAIRFFEALVAPNTSLLERVEPLTAYDKVVAPRLDAFLGHDFERMVEPTYERLRVSRSLPTVRIWSRWEGSDRNRRGLEIDIVAPLSEGGVMTGSVKWNRRPLGPKSFFDHLDALRRAADAGHRWAHEAQQGPLVFVSAAGVDARFKAVAEAHPNHVIAWSLEDVDSQA